MGLYDREYYREDSGGGFFGAAGRSMVNTLIAINVIIYLVDIFTVQPGDRHWLSDLLSVQVGTIYQPLQWYRFLTCGFAHDPNNIMHIGFNMLMLWMFGREVEAIYGPKEFLRMYLVAIVVSALTWAFIARIQGEDFATPMLGASGAISAVLVLFALNFPKRTILVMFVLPLPAWVVIGIVIVMNISGAFGGPVPGDNGSLVAYTAHLGGLAFGFVYYFGGLNFGRILPDVSRLKRIGQPKLKVHRPPSEQVDTRSFEARVDEVLEKFHRAGEESLTADERKLLEEASRRYQQRRR